MPEAPVVPAAPPATPPATPPSDPGRVEIPTNLPQPPAAPAAVDFSTVVPEAYRAKEYLKDVKDMDALFKKLDGAQELLGKRPAGIPHDNAKPEEIAAFNKAFGVPDAPAAYELVVPAENPMPKEMIEGVKGIFHKAGLNAKQAKMVSEGWNAMLAEQAKAAGIQTQAQDTNFEQLATETFGENKTTVLASSKALLEKYASEKFKAHINGLSNENLIVMASVLEGVRKDYISEDDLPNRGSGGGGNAASDVQSQARELMKTDAYKNGFHPDHAATKAKVDALYASLNKK